MFVRLTEASDDSLEVVINTDWIVSLSRSGPHTLIWTGDPGYSDDGASSHFAVRETPEQILAILAGSSAAPAPAIPTSTRAALLRMRASLAEIKAQLEPKP